MLEKGFTVIPNILLKSERLNSDQKIVLFVLMSFNPSHPGLNRIQECTGLSRPTVIKCIRFLEANNHITVQRSHRKSNNYRVNGVYSTGKGRLPKVVKGVYSNKTKEKEQIKGNEISTEEGRNKGLAKMREMRLLR